MSTSKVTTVGPISIWIEWNETVTDDYFTYHPQIYASTTRNVGDPSAPTKFTLYENGQTVTSISSWQYPGGVYYPSGYGKGPYCIYTWDYSKTGISFPRQKVRIDQIQTIRLYQQFDNFYGGTSGSSYKITIDETLLIPAKPGELQIQPDPPEITSDIGDSVSIGDKYYARWRYLPTMGDNQIKYEIQYGNSLVDDEIDEPETTGVIESSQNIHIFDTNHLTVGDTIYWQVRTYGFALDEVEEPPNDGWSNWSIIHATSIVAQPAPSHKFLNNLNSSGGLWPHIKQYISDFFTNICKDHIIENQTVEKLVEEYTEGSETVTHNVKWEYHLWDSNIIDAQGIFQTKVTSDVHIVAVPLPKTMASTSYLFFAGVDNYYCRNVYAGWDTSAATSSAGSNTKNIEQAQVAMDVTGLQGQIITVRVWLHGKIANTGQNTVLTFTNPSQWSQNPDNGIHEGSAEGTIYTDVMSLSPSYDSIDQRVVINSTGNRIVTTTPVPIGSGMKIQAHCNNGYEFCILPFKTSTYACYAGQNDFISWTSTVEKTFLPKVDCIGIGLHIPNDSLDKINVANAGLVIEIFDGGEING